MKATKLIYGMTILGAVTTCLALNGSAMALTFKSGQVMGADGKVYNGASPEQAANIIAASKLEGLFGTKRKTAGVKGDNLYVIVNETVTFIPLSDVRGKSDGQIEALIVERVTENFDVPTGGGLSQSNAGVVGAAQAAGQEASDEVLASQAEIDAAIGTVGAFSAAASDAAAVTREAWGDISAADLDAAVAEATAHAVAEAAAVTQYLDITAALQELQESGASEAEIDEFIAANPAP